MDTQVKVPSDNPTNVTTMIPAHVIEQLLKAHLYSSVLSGQASLPALLRQLLAPSLPLRHLLYIETEGHYDNFKLYSFSDSEAGDADLYQTIRRYLALSKTEREKNVALLLRQLNEPPPADSPATTCWLCHPLSRLEQGWVLLEVEQPQVSMARTMLQLIELRLLELSSERQLHSNNQQLKQLQQSQSFQQLLINWFEHALEQISLPQSCTDLLLSLRQHHPQWGFYLLNNDGQLMADTPEMEAFSQWQPLCRQLDGYHHPLHRELWIDPPALRRLLSEQTIDAVSLPDSKALEHFHWLALPLHRGQQPLATLVAWSPHVRLQQSDRQHFSDAGHWLANLLQIRQQESKPAPPKQDRRSQPSRESYIGGDELQPEQLLLAQLELVVSHLRRHPHHLYALCYLGLDRLEQLASEADESRSKQTVDALQQEAARRLRRSLRPNDLLCHYQDHDFLILIDNMREPQDAEEIVLRLLELFQSPFYIGTDQLMLSCYVGIGLLTSSQPAKLQLHKVRIAMQTARQQQLGAYLFADELGHNRGTVPLEQAIRDALHEGQVTPFFQPVVRLKDRQLVGFEVVARWRNNLDWQEASRFITTAERSGLVVQLDYEMLRQSYRQLHQWLKGISPSPPLTLTLNLSGRHLSTASAMAQLLDVVEQERNGSLNLCFEFTERDCLRYNGNAITALSQARKAGIRVGLDDFGTGPSSLKALFNYPIDYIKVDQSFTQNMLSSNRNLALIRAIRDISHDLGFEVVVEGIETAVQYQKLEALGCEYGQGFFIAPPLSPADAGKLLSGERL